MMSGSSDTPTKLERILVIISPDMVKPGAPMKSTLVKRALALGRASGGEIEFFHVCHDDALTGAFFTDPHELKRQRLEYLTREATLMAELVVRLDAQGVIVNHDTHWDTPRSDAILRKIDQFRPDLVMKQSREHNYFMGLVGNTDWDLVRRSPAHLWFVTEGSDNQVERVVTAVGSDSDDEEVISAVDNEVFRVANLIAEQFDATNYPVHAYQVPRGRSYAADAPKLGGPSYPISAVVPAEKAGRRTAQKHERAMEGFAERFAADPSCIRVREGSPSVVLPEMAKSLNASLIVMAAHNLSRWERLFRTVTAEPVLAESTCDVVFVKDASDASAPTYSKTLTQGIPAYDLELAVLHPQDSFGSPHEVGEAKQVSVAMRKRIIQKWEKDIRAQIAEENVGDHEWSTKTDLLRSIVNTKSKLASEEDYQNEKSAGLVQH